jgi:C4-dicarboxylate transporter/malic acid transport protein
MTTRIDQLDGALAEAGSASPAVPGPGRTARAGGLRGFHPGWYGAVMGTAIIAIAASMNPGQAGGAVTAGRDAAEAFGILAALLGAGLAVPYVARVILHPGAVWADLKDPVNGALYATFPAGILILALMVARVGSLVLPAGSILPLVESLGGLGMLLGFALSVVHGHLLVVHPKVGAATAFGGWFIPPVTNLVVPLVLLPLMPHVSPAAARFLLALGYGFWGMGMLLFILVAAQVYDRLVVHPLPHPSLSPATWIFLGPIGVGSIALVQMAQGGQHLFGPAAPSVQTLSLLGATALWGFGIWAFAQASLLLIHHLRSGPIPFGVGWWAFTFPLGAYTVATLTLARAWQIGSLELTGAALFLLLVMFWLLVALGTVWSWRRVGESRRRAAA